MIYESYYSYIKNYQRDNGKEYLENVYNIGKERKVDKDCEEVGLQELTCSIAEVARYLGVTNSRVMRFIS